MPIGRPVRRAAFLRDRPPREDATPRSPALPGSRIIDGHYKTVRQAIATKHQAVALKREVNQFLVEAKASGLVADLIEKHGVTGRLKVASNT